jgi:hypothetical protein
MAITVGMALVTFALTLWKAGDKINMNVVWTAASLIGTRLFTVYTSAQTQRTTMQQEMSAMLYDKMEDSGAGVVTVIMEVGGGGTRRVCGWGGGLGGAGPGSRSDLAGFGGRTGAMEGGQPEGAKMVRDCWRGRLHTPTARVSPNGGCNPAAVSLLPFFATLLRQTPRRRWRTSRSSRC